MKRKIIALLFILFPVFSSSAIAVTSTSSASTSNTEETEVNTNLQDRIRNMVQQNVSTTEAQIKEKINQLSLVGYTGKVTEVTASNLTIDSDGETFQVTTNDTTTIVNAGKNIKLSTIAIGEKLIVIGTFNTKKDVITAKRIVVVKASEVTNKPTIYTGIIQTVDIKKRTVVIKSLDKVTTMILSKKANLKIEEIVAGKNVLVITRIQDVGTVITKAKIL